MGSFSNEEIASLTNSLSVLVSIKSLLAQPELIAPLLSLSVPVVSFPEDPLLVELESLPLLLPVSTPLSVSPPLPVSEDESPEYCDPVMSML